MPGLGARVLPAREILDTHFVSQPGTHPWRGAHVQPPRSVTQIPPAAAHPTPASSWAVLEAEPLLPLKKAFEGRGGLFEHSVSRPQQRLVPPSPHTGAQQCGFEERQVSAQAVGALIAQSCPQDEGMREQPHHARGSRGSREGGRSRD